MSRKHARLIAVAGLAASVAMVATQANAQDRVRWKMQSAFGSSLIHLGPSGLRFAERVNQMSGGAFDIRFQEPGALVPALEAFDSVSKGAIESAWTTPGYHTGKLGGAISFFTAVPFGPQLGEYLAWKWFGGGQELREEMYNAHGATAVDCFCIGPETSGWFKEEITSMEQIKGLKMRFFGLGAKVMQKMGASTQLLAGADIYPALERGVIDATEFSMPTIDIQLGFYQIAKNNYFPGWHQQVSCSEFLMNKEMHDALPDAYKGMIQRGGARAGGLHLRRDRGEEPGGDDGDAREVRRHQPPLAGRHPEDARGGLDRGRGRGVGGRPDVRADRGKLLRLPGSLPGLG